MIRNLKVIGLAMGVVLAMSAIASSSALATPEFTCADVGVHKSCVFKGTTEAGLAEVFEAGLTVKCHNSHEASDADGTGTKIFVITSDIRKPFDAPSGATTDTDCESILFGLRFTTHVRFNACGYELHSRTKLAANEYTAEVDIVCPAGKVIEVEVTNAEAKRKCLVTVPAQKELKHLILNNKDNKITVTIKVTNIKYTVVEGALLGCGKANAMYTNGVYSGSETVEAVDTSGKAITGSVVGE